MRLHGTALACLATIVLCACEKKTPSTSPPAGPPPPSVDPFTPRFDWAPTEGSRVESDDRMNMKMKLFMKAQGKEFRNDGEQGQEFTYSDETVKVASGNSVERRVTFSRATHSADGKPETLGIEGKTVTGKRDGDGPWRWTGEKDQLLERDDQAAVEEALGARAGGGTGGQLESGFAPKGAVKAADGWAFDPRPVIERVLDAGTEVDWKSSTGHATLRSAEKSGQTIHGALEFTMDLQVTKTGGLNLDKPLLYKVRGELNGCLDGSAPDGTLHLEMSAEGNRTATKPGTSQTADFELKFEMTMDSRRRLAK